MFILCSFISFDVFVLFDKLSFGIDDVNFFQHMHELKNVLFVNHVPAIISLIDCNWGAIASFWFCKSLLEALFVRFDKVHVRVLVFNLGLSFEVIKIKLFKSDSIAIRNVLLSNSLWSLILGIPKEMDEVLQLLHEMSHLCVSHFVYMLVESTLSSCSRLIKKVFASRDGIFDSLMNNCFINVCCTKHHPKNIFEHVFWSWYKVFKSEEIDWHLSILDLVQPVLMPSYPHLYFRFKPLVPVRFDYFTCQRFFNRTSVCICGGHHEKAHKHIQWISYSY
mgnify:CR=1 FL=1